ncbi:MAG: MFS transporter [Gammaproteobacteria bacterium]|nr:MFS transporter [Gammaproteobacteria bacterium]
MNDQNARFGPVSLAVGVSRLNMTVFLLSAFAGMMLNTFISVVQPYILNVNLALPVAEQGRISGEMVFYGEVVILLLSAAIGLFTDKLGRRGMYAGGFVIMAMGYSLYGFVDSVGSLAAVRVFLAIAISVINVMIATVQADYPKEESRGKLVGLTGVVIGLGAVLIGVGLARLPFWFVGAGYDDLLAGRLTLFVMSAMSLLMAIVVWFGLSTQTHHDNAAPLTLKENFAIGISAARNNLRVALAYGCAFVSRGDLVVVGTFYVLWMNQAAVETGMSPDEASKVAGGFFGLVMGSALLWAPVSGWLSDRLNRVSAMAVAMGLCAIGYTSMGLIAEPLGGWMYPAGILLGIGQMSAITASQTLIGQEAPPASRGTIVGVFSFFGAAGVMFITIAGGRLYDAIDPSAPFVLIGIVNALLFLCAVLLRLKSRKFD